MKKHILLVTFHIKKTSLALFSEEVRDYQFPDYEKSGRKLTIRRVLWEAQYSQMTWAAIDKAKENNKPTTNYYETFKHGNVFDFLKNIEDKNYPILNLKSEDSLEQQLCQILININEPIEIRIEVEYNKEGTRV